MCIRDRLRRYARDETANGGPARTPGGGYRQAEPVPAVPPQSEGASVMALLRRLIGDALRAQRITDQAAQQGHDGRSLRLRWHRWHGPSLTVPAPGVRAGPPFAVSSLA